MQESVKWTKNPQGWAQRIVLVLIIFLSPLSLAAQGVEVLADRVQKAYEKTQDLQMHFTQETYVEVLDKKVNKKGEAQFKKPGKFVIRYFGTRGRQYYNNGKELWIYHSGDKQAQVYSSQDQDIPPEALSFLGGLGKLKQDFAVEVVSKKKWQALKREKGDLQWLELTPLKKRSQIQWLVMGFDPNHYLAQEVYLFTDSGNLSHYVLSNLAPNTGLNDEIFEFKQKGVKKIRVKP